MSKTYFKLKRYPEYHITRTGKVHHGSHIPWGSQQVIPKKDENGLPFVELKDSNGVYQREYIADLLQETFPPKVRKVEMEEEERWVTIEEHPLYEINQAGQVRKRGSWEYLVQREKPGRVCPIYYLDGKPAHINTLLYRAFGVGAATRAGYPEPRRLDRMKK